MSAGTDYECYRRQQESFLEKKLLPRAEGPGRQWSSMSGGGSHSVQLPSCPGVTRAGFVWPALPCEVPLATAVGSGEPEMKTLSPRTRFPVSVPM